MAKGPTVEDDREMTHPDGRVTGEDEGDAGFIPFP
jgi:hypothetical protein